MLQDLKGIQTVLLDMDGTLLDLHYDNYFWVQEVPRIYSEIHDMNRADAVDYLSPIFKRLEGQLDWYCVDHWSDLLGFDVMRHKAEVAGRIAWRPQAQQFLQLCQDTISDTRLVTNGHRKVLNLKIEHTGLDQYFSDMICSHELAAPKEHQDFWHRLQAMRAFDPSTTLFIDDSERVLDSAAEFGIKHVYSIAQPDSVTPRSSVSKFEMLESFPGLG